MKRKYLYHLKTLMLKRLSWSDIRETLKDVNDYFDSGRALGKSEDELINELGTVEEFVKAVDECSDVKKPPKTRVNLRYLFMMAVMLLMVISTRFFEIQEVTICSMCLFILLFAILIWFGSGISCLIGIMPFTRRECKSSLFSQLLIIILAILEQIFILYGSKRIMQHYEKSGAIYLSGEVISGVIYFSIAVSILVLMYGMYKFMMSNILMFGTILQAISLLLSSVAYIFYMRRVDDINLMFFMIYPYFFGLAIVILFYLRIIRKGTMEDGRKV